MSNNSYSTEPDPTASEAGGYGDSGYGGSSDKDKNPYGSSESAYGSSSYGGSVLDGSDSAESGAYGTDQFQDGYSENPYEVNPFDTPYSERPPIPIRKGLGTGTLRATRPSLEGAIARGLRTTGTMTSWCFSSAPSG